MEYTGIVSRCCFTIELCLFQIVNFEILILIVCIALFTLCFTVTSTQAGEPKFVDLALKFVYGNDSIPILENRVHGTQALSGTGGLRVFGEMMRKHGHKHIYVPNPTWGNHIPIFTNAGLEVRKYRYYDREKSNLDFSGLIDDIKSMPKGSIILLHACK